MLFIFWFLDAQHIKKVELYGSYNKPYNMTKTVSSCPYRGKTTNPSHNTVIWFKIIPGPDFKANDSFYYWMHIIEKSKLRRGKAKQIFIHYLRFDIISPDGKLLLATRHREENKFLKKFFNVTKYIN